MHWTVVLSSSIKPWAETSIATRGRFYSSLVSMSSRKCACPLQQQDMGKLPTTTRVFSVRSRTNITITDIYIYIYIYILYIYICVCVCVCVCVYIKQWNTFNATLIFCLGWTGCEGRRSHHVAQDKDGERAMGDGQRTSRSASCCVAGLVPWQQLFGTTWANVSEKPTCSSLKATVYKLRQSPLKIETGNCCCLTTLSTASVQHWWDVTDRGRHKFWEKNLF